MRKAGHRPRQSLRLRLDARAADLSRRARMDCGWLKARGGVMGSIPVEQFLEHPDRLLSEAQGGEIALVTQDGEPVFMAVPMGASLDARKVRLEIAVSLFDREQVSIGVGSPLPRTADQRMI